MHFKDRYSYLLALKETQKQIFQSRCVICEKIGLQSQYTDESEVFCLNCLKSYKHIPDCNEDETLSTRTKLLLDFHRKLLIEWSTAMLPKINGRGETPLHLACKMKKLNDVVKLLKDGENVNIKDFAGWLPLHDAILTGSEEIVSVLLNAGSCVNAPGLNYDTPLHIALFNSQLKIASLLIDYGADLSQKNFDGITPKELKSFEHSSAHCKLEIEKKITEMRDMEEKYGPVNIFYYDDRVFDIVQELAEVNCQFRYTNKTWNNVTHVVSYDSVVDTCNPHVLRAIVNGIPAVTVDWLKACARIGYCVSPEQYFVKVSSPYTNDSIKKSIENNKKLFPKLFDNINFYIMDSRKSVDPNVKLGNSFLSEKWLPILIEEGGGKILKREPSESTLQDVPKHFPWHAEEKSTMENCCHVIIYNQQRQLKYNMPELKHIPAVWVIECIWRYRLVSLSEIQSDLIV